MAGFDDASSEYIMRLQQGLACAGFDGKQTKNLLPHSTLCTADASQLSTLTKLMEHAACSSAFSVDFQHIGLFSGGSVLFLAPDINRELLRLKETFSAEESWTAHTTLLIDTPENIRAALPTVTAQFKSFMTKITSLHLYEFWPTRHILSLQLQSQ